MIFLNSSDLEFLICGTPINKFKLRIMVPNFYIYKNLLSLKKKEKKKKHLVKFSNRITNDNYISNLKNRLFFWFTFGGYYSMKNLSRYMKFNINRHAWSIEFHHLIAKNKKEIRIQTLVKMASPNFSLITKCFLVVLLSIALVILNSSKIYLLTSVIFDTLRKKTSIVLVIVLSFIYG